MTTDDTMTNWSDQPTELGADLAPDLYLFILGTIELRLVFVTLAAAARARALRTWAGGTQ